LKSINRHKALSNPVEVMWAKKSVRNQQSCGHAYDCYTYFQQNNLIFAIRLLSFMMIYDALQYMKSKKVGLYVIYVMWHYYFICTMIWCNIWLEIYTIIQKFGVS